MTLTPQLERKRLTHELFGEDGLRDYTAAERDTIQSDALITGRYVLSELSAGRKPYVVDPDLREREGLDGKYTVDGIPVLSGYADADAGRAAEVATHEHMHAVLTGYDTAERVHAEEDVHRLTEGVLDYFAWEQDDPGVQSVAQNGYIALMERFLTMRGYHDSEAASLLKGALAGERHQHAVAKPRFDLGTSLAGLWDFLYTSATAGVRSYLEEFPAGKVLLALDAAYFNGGAIDTEKTNAIIGVRYGGKGPLLTYFARSDQSLTDNDITIDVDNRRITLGRGKQLQVTDWQDVFDNRSFGRVASKFFYPSLDLLPEREARREPVLDSVGYYLSQRAPSTTLPDGTEIRVANLPPYRKGLNLRSFDVSDGTESLLRGALQYPVLGVYKWAATLGAKAAETFLSPFPLVGRASTENIKNRLLGKGDESYAIVLVKGIGDFTRTVTGLPHEEDLALGE